MQGKMLVNVHNRSTQDSTTHNLC